MASTARQGTIDKVNAALVAVTTAQASLDAARVTVANVEAALETAQRRVGYGLRIFRSELELRVADVATHVSAASSSEEQKDFAVDLEDGDAFDLASATRIRDYLLSVHTSRLP